MWNMQSASKLIEERMKKRTYDLHQNKLQKMKPRMRIEPPEQPDFVFTKNKQEMARRDRLNEIDKHNQILLSKMDHIRKAEYKENKLRPEAQQLKTLNLLIMNQQAEQIYHQNQRLCSKLMKTPSFYQTNQIVTKTDNLQRIRGNISQNARRAQSASSLRRPVSSRIYASSKFLRTGADSRPETAPNTRGFSAKSSRHRPYSSERRRREEDYINAEQRQ